MLNLLISEGHLMVAVLYCLKILQEDIRKIVEVSVYIKEKKMRCEALLIMDHQLCYRVK